MRGPQTLRWALPGLLLLSLSLSLPGPATAQALPQPQPAKPGLKIGDPLPDLSLPAPRRAPGTGPERQRLRGPGEKVLVVSFFASYCLPCREELPALMRALSRAEQAAPAGTKVRLIGIGVDQDPADSLRFAAEVGFTGQVLVDPQGEARAAFAPGRYPCTFFIDQGLVVRHINRGYGPGYQARAERWLRGLLAP